MTKEEKAVALYMRGFSNQYIKRRTGWSITQLVRAGHRADVHAIRKYQVAYIKARYTHDEIVAAYAAMWKRHDDPYRASRGRSVVFLGCGFGDFDRVLGEVLGRQVYRNVRRQLQRSEIAI